MLRFVLLIHLELLILCADANIKLPAKLPNAMPQENTPPDMLRMCGGISLYKYSSCTKRKIRGYIFLQKPLIHSIKLRIDTYLKKQSCILKMTIRFYGEYGTHVLYGSLSPWLLETMEIKCKHLYFIKYVWTLCYDTRKNMLTSLESL